MPTARTVRQALGDWGEAIVSKFIACPKCKSTSTLETLPLNFTCADIICGFLAQVPEDARAYLAGEPVNVLPVPFKTVTRLRNFGPFLTYYSVHCVR
jgi:hypothetical protein